MKNSETAGIMSTTNGATFGKRQFAYMAYIGAHDNREKTEQPT